MGRALTLARFSEAFLILKAQAAGLPVALAPAVLVGMSAVFALSAYPAGVLSDRVDRRSILAAGAGVLVAADLVLALAPSLAGVGLGVMLWGLHMGLTQGLLATLIADTARPELRGTAFGIFNLACGVATLLASVIAGALWDITGPGGTFIGGAAFSLLALFGLLAVRDRLPCNGM